LIRFRFTYLIYDNTVLAKYFEVKLKNTRIGHVEEPPKMLKKVPIYTFKATHLVWVLFAFIFAVLSPIYFTDYVLTELAFADSHKVYKFLPVFLGNFVFEGI